MMAETLSIAAATVDDFKPLTGSQFVVKQVGGESVDMTFTLMTATALVGGYALAKRGAFSLTFNGPRQPIYRQNTFTLVHEKLGELSIFMVPIGTNSDGCLYEAVFN
jgi:hypothetical protein